MRTLIFGFRTPYTSNNQIQHPGGLRQDYRQHLRSQGSTDFYGDSSFISLDPTPASKTPQQQRPLSPGGRSIFKFISSFDALSNPPATQQQKRKPVRTQPSSAPSTSNEVSSWTAVSVAPKRKSVENLMDQLTRGQGSLPPPAQFVTAQFDPYAPQEDLTPIAQPARSRPLPPQHTQQGTSLPRASPPKPVVQARQQRRSAKLPIGPAGMCNYQSGPKDNNQRLAGVTSDGGLVVCKLPKVIRNDVAGKIVLCVLPAEDLNPLHAVKWHPREPEYVAVASETNVYLVSISDALQVFSGEPIPQSELQRVGQLFSVPSTPWIANNRRESMIAFRLNFDTSTPSPGGEEARGPYFDQVVEFAGPKPTIHFVILTAHADPHGVEAQAACVAAKVPPGELALVTFVVHSSGVDQILIHKEWLTFALASMLEKFPLYIQPGLQTEPKNTRQQQQYYSLPVPQTLPPPAPVQAAPSIEAVDPREESRALELKGRGPKGKNGAWKNSNTNNKDIGSGRDKDGKGKAPEASGSESPLAVVLTQKIEKVEETLHSRIGRMLGKELDKQWCGSPEGTITINESENRRVITTTKHKILARRDHMHRFRISLLHHYAHLQLWPLPTSIA
ncbi:hypothetical protein BC835DRAFT_1309816 [Cytidiella melzeri]|nr:hypothetical protein BC835DRAFT_1309816 [Cytidiella melzeri]